MSNDEVKKKHLSYSAYSTWMQCPKKYEYNYIQKLRPISQPAHLIFGSATDRALNEILLGKTKEEALAACEVDLHRLFTDSVELETKDYDQDLIGETEGALLANLRDCGFKGDDYNHLATVLLNKVKYRESLSPGQAKALNWLVFYSFREKIALIIDGFNEYVLPKITEVISVQTYVKRGILDFQARIEGVEGIVTCDNKTASRPYERDAVKVSVQLAGYGATTGAYIVFDKNVRKNRVKTCSVCGNDGTGKRHKTCDAMIKKPATIDGIDVKYSVRCEGEWEEYISPEIIPQIIIDEVSEHNRVMVEEAYQATEKLIEAGSFPRNLTNCGKQFGRPCPYIDLCWHGSEKGLKKHDQT